MLILPIKRKWLEMIRSGEKKEEYREIKPYYTSRVRNLITFKPWTDGQTIEVIKSCGAKGAPFDHVVLRGGYDLLAPAVRIKGTITIGEGRPEWGAEPGKRYYIFRIDEAEDLLTVNGQRSLAKCYRELKRNTTKI